MANKTKGCLTVFVVLLAVGFLGSVLGGRSSDKDEPQSEIAATEVEIEPEKQGVTGIKSSKNKPEIEYFSYHTEGNTVKLESYIGTGSLIELQPSYVIDGKEYLTDLSEFSISHSADTVIINEGITEVNTSIFNLLMLA